MFTNVIKPLCRRIGSYLVGLLSGIVAFSPDQLSQAEIILTGALLLACDLLHSYANRRGWL